MVAVEVFAHALHLFIYYPSKYKLVATQRSVCVGHAQVMGVLPLCPLWIRDFTTTHTNSPPPLQLGGATLVSAEHLLLLKMADFLELLTFKISVSHIWMEE